MQYAVAQVWSTTGSGDGRIWTLSPERGCVPLWEERAAAAAARHLMLEKPAESNAALRDLLQKYDLVAK
jgi:hypothetical protein